jgi:hypothetical protein
MRDLWRTQDHFKNEFTNIEHPRSIYKNILLFCFGCNHALTRGSQTMGPLAMLLVLSKGLQWGCGHGDRFTIFWLTQCKLLNSKWLSSLEIKIKITKMIFLFCLWPHLNSGGPHCSPKMSSTRKFAWQSYSKFLD